MTAKKPTEKQLRFHLEQTLMARAEHHEDEMKAYKSALESFPSYDVNNGVYEVNIFSHWADYGEQSIESAHIGSLEDALKKAGDKFCEVNSRSDVQGSWTVYAHVKECKVKIPTKMIGYVYNWEK